MRRNRIYWSALGTLAALCCVLAVLQYRWIGEISRADSERIRASLQASLQRLSREFNFELSTECAALQPPPDGASSLELYQQRYSQWRSSTKHPDLFRRLAVAVPRHRDIELLLLQPETGVYIPSAWPQEWLGLQQRMLTRLMGGPPPNAPEDSALFEFPRFGRGRQTEQDWLIIELDVPYVTAQVLPDLLERQLGGGLPVNVEIRWRSGGRIMGWPNPQEAILAPDATVGLLDLRTFMGRGGGPPPGVRALGGPGRGGPTPGRWNMLVRSREGSLEATVAKARSRNILISGAILLLLLVTVGVLLRLSLRAEQLAEAQLNFVAGVSHELRTPLTVIRTAAYNLRGRIAASPAQVERYGQLIQDESEKLTAMIDQVLLFAGTQAGKVVRDRTPVSIADVVDQALQSSIVGSKGSLEIEKDIPPSMPLVLADSMALGQALRNLIDNAAKHGSDWLRIAVSHKDNCVEIRVADRGPGIPSDERSRIFEPFFRGKRAIEEQVHGTGLGLNLVKRIVEAHQGTVEVKSNAESGTEFVVRIPVAPSGLVNEAAHTAG